MEATYAAGIATGNAIGDDVEPDVPGVAGVGALLERRRLLGR